jgi:inhibitor of KinA sporulation pathway (predicted exonuclease)
MILYDKILVLDIEATCWEGDGDYQKTHSEIIEIGICKYVVATGEIEAKKSYYIKPEHSEISNFCTKLTGITAEKLDLEGTSLETALKKIKNKYGSSYRVWGGFGDFDKKILESECRKKGIRHRFDQTYWNIRSMMIIKSKTEKGFGLRSALEFLNEPFEGSPHNGADDAFNTAKLLRYVLG